MKENGFILYRIRGKYSIHPLRALDLLFVQDTMLATELPSDVHTDFLSMLWQAVDKSAHTVLITDLSGAIEYVNPKFTELTGYTYLEVKGKNPRFLQSGETPRSTYRSMWQSLADGKSWQGEVTNKRKNGSLYFVILTVSPIFNQRGEVTHYLGIEEDISYRKTLEVELTKTVDEMKNFLAIVSHDLKSPLTTIMGALGILSRNSEIPSKNKLIQTAKATATRMCDLITDLLNYARLGMETIIFENVALEKVIEDVLSDLEGTLTAKGVQVSIDPLPTVTGSEPLLRQLFQNLIENAIKYNRSSSPTIHITATLRGNRWNIKVRDNGVGIDSTDKDKLFLPFSRLQSTSREVSGSGLGLAHCKKVVSLHGGHISIESHPGEGSTVLFDLLNALS